mgnify:CR=1
SFFVDTHNASSKPPRTLSEVYPQFLPVHDDSADTSLGLFFSALHFGANLQLFAGMRYQLPRSMKCTFPLLIVVLVFARASIGFADESLFKRE